ncbi:unnamed protein product [Chironomus riparius]|uniref:Uncharacterized protein n=1 Tax=Chironomus riparius TaxID=315576 RepID=A0A9N9RWZ5_9DIPT|nr:unnamed protein product [Chironomus riparius]
MNYLLILILSISSGSAITFNCLYSFNDFVLIGKEYTCWATISNVTESNVLFDVIGTHQAEKDNSDVFALEIQNATQLTFIPQGIEIFFPNLWALIIGNHSILQLDGDELRNYNDLKLFGLINGKLEKISGDLFDPTPHMTHLWLTKNKIKNLTESFINYSENLMFADFTDNDCISMQATNQFEMEDLAENLRVNCTEGSIDAVAAPAVVVETLIEDTNEIACENGNEVERICRLEKENEILNGKIKELVVEIENLRNNFGNLNTVEAMNKEEFVEES